LIASSASVRRRPAPLAVLVLGLLVGGVLAILRPDAASAAGPTPVAISLTMSPNPAAVAEQVTLTATVTPPSGGATPTGSVTFTDGSTPLNPGGTALDGTGKATTTAVFLTTGSHNITANYAGDSTYAAASVTRTERVLQSVTRKTWSGGGGDGKWSTASNWAGGTVPTTGDVVVLPTSTSTDDFGNLSLGGIELTGTPTVNPASGTTMPLTGDILGDSITATPASINVPIALASGAHFVDAALSLPGAVSGSGDLTKTGPGTVSVGSANTYTGATDIVAGILSAAGGGGLGGAATGTTVETGATLALGGLGSSEPLSLNGDGVNGLGALTLSTGTVSSGITLNGSQVTIGSSGTPVVTGKLTGGAKLVLAGASAPALQAANDYSGGTGIVTGVLAENNSALGTGAVTVGPSANLTLGSAVALPNAITTGANSILRSQAAGGRLTGAIAASGNTSLIATASGTLEIDSVVSGAGAINTLGSVFLSGQHDNTFSGGATVTSGVLDIGKVDGTVALPAGANVGAELDMDNDNQVGDAATVTVVTGAVFDMLGTSDTFATLASDGDTYLGIFDPANGSSFSRLALTDMTTIGGQLFMAVDGTQPGISQDEITVSHSISLTGTRLSVSGDVPFASTVKLIDNTGTSPVNGTFLGLPEGASVQTATRTATISYHGGDGNDVTLTERPARSGYWMMGSDGKVYPFGDAKSYGDVSNLALAGDPVALEPTPDYNGYWILTSDGSVFAYGDASYLGNPSSQLDPNEIATSISSDGANGYWIFTDEGRAFPFGDAAFFGDMDGVPLNGPVLGSVTTPGGQGYYMVASDGGIFSFGNAHFYGSMGGKPLNGPVVGLAPDPDGVGYWLVATDGGIFAFSSNFKGSMGGQPLNQPVVGMVAYGDGYLMVGADGGIFDFSSKPFQGSLGNSPPANPVITVAALNEH
jgi:autotransporter-associated beta strand protein